MNIPVVDKRDIRFTRVAVNSVPLQSSTFSITQDPTGFLWFGTIDGLLRHDGYTVKNYRGDRGSPNSVGDGEPKSVYRDRSGILWIGTPHRGLHRLDPVQDVFTHYLHDPGNPQSLGSNDVRCVFQDTAGTLWVGTAAGLNRLDPTTGKFTHYSHDARDTGSLSNDLVLAITEDRRHNLWVGTAAGLNRLERNTDRFLRFRHDPADPNSLGDDYVNAIAEDQSGVLWVGGLYLDGLSALDAKSGDFTLYFFHPEESGSQSIAGVSAICEDGDGVLWLGTRDRGLLKFDREHKQIARYSKQPSNPYSLGNDAVKTIFEDAEGVIWVGTQEGVSRFARKPLAFVTYQQDPGDPRSLHDNTIRSVRGDNQGFLWIGTKLGLNQLNRTTGEVTVYRHDERKIYSLSSDRVSAIREGRAGELWVATFGSGLNRFDPITRRFTAYRHDPRDPASLSNDSIECLWMDRQGVLWVGTQEGGFHRFDAAAGRFKHYRNLQDDPQTAAGLVKPIYEDRAGIIWLGKLSGLNRFDPKTEQFTVYRHDPRDPSSLSHNVVNSILEDRQGRLWIGTPNGLNQMDRSRGSFTTLTTRDGLPDANVETILEDRQGYLWIGTHNGLSRFHPPTKRFRNYSEADGLPGSLLNPYGVESAWQSADGEMFFGSLNGLVAFYPDRLAPNPYVPPVVLTELSLFNKPVLPGRDSPLDKPIWATRALTFSHDQSIFTLGFAGLSNAAPENNLYRYRLDPLEPDWNEVDSRRRQATYTSLAAGHYVFRVQASSKDGVWNEKGVTLAVTVLPPWWAEWWFRAMVGATIAAAVVAAHKVRVRGLKVAATRLETQVAERTRELAVAKEAAERANQAKGAFLAAMSHELRTPLNAILGFSAMVRDSRDLAENHRENLDIVNRSGEHLLGLIDDVLDTAKIEAGGLTLDLRSFDVIRAVQDNIDMMRVRCRQKNVDLILAISPTVPRYIRSDPGRFRQVLINLLGNAVKFTERGSVTVRLDARNSLLILEVEDTGIGIAPQDQGRIFDAFVQAGNITTQKGTGLGLSIAQQFVQMMAGTIGVESTPGQGSRFRVELPVEAVDESAVTASRQHKEIIGLAPGQSYRILIVEDRKENWLLLQGLLAGVGFQVQVAEDGAQGVEKFRAWQPHFIWMDVGLPVMGGAEAAARIRLMEGGRDVKIVALSASVLAAEREAILAAGFDESLRKPVRREEIFDCLARHLNVRFVYQEAPSPHSAEPVRVQRTDLSILPVRLRQELADAVVSLNPSRIQEVIARVADHDAPSGEFLSFTAKRLAYTEILKALEESGIRLREQAW